MRLETDGPLSLEIVLNMGQSFRWRARGDGFVGVAGGHLFHLQQTGAEEVRFRADPREGAVETLRWHLRLDAGHHAALKRLGDDAALAGATRRHAGLRVLRVEPWEAVASFILSSNNNVQRIEGIVERVARSAGGGAGARRVDAPWHGEPWHPFPPAGAVAALGAARLRGLGAGYRAEYLAEAARMVAAGEVDLAEVQRAPLHAAREILQELPGVGPKVAECALLFGFDRQEAFPVDRWVERGMAEVLGEDGLPHRELRARARERWGSLAGLANQLVFFDARARRVGRDVAAKAEGAGDASDTGDTAGAA